jgi:hypothetical protein
MAKGKVTFDIETCNREKKKGRKPVARITNVTQDITVTIDDERK